jgi:hypothetical protein
MKFSTGPCETMKIWAAVPVSVLFSPFRLGPAKTSLQRDGIRHVEPEGAALHRVLQIKEIQHSFWI